MMQLDEMSRTLGAIQADINYIRKATDEGNGKIDTLTRTSIIQGEELKAAHKRLDHIEPLVNDFVAIKNRGVGAALTLGSIGGFISLGFIKLIEKVF